MNKFLDLYTNKYFVLMCRIFIGGLFIYASIDKILAPTVFAEAVINYYLVPSILVPLIAVFLPWFELITGIMLLIGYKQRLAAFCITGLLIVFLFGITLNVLRGFEMNCGCFEFFGIKETLSWWTVLRDLIFLFFTIPPFISKEKFLAIKVD